MSADGVPDDDGPDTREPWLVSRRDVLAGGAAGAAYLAAGIGDPVLAQAAAASPTPAAFTDRVALMMTVNGEARTLDLDPRTSLLDALREHLELTGSKKGCDHGQCGACTVHIDGRRVVSCLTMAAQAEGREVLTIEGLASGDALHPMQQAFIDHDGLQCGYCTPGQVMSAVACIREGHATGDPTIRESMSGNLCRCGAYPGILAAVRDVAAQGVIPVAREA